MFSRNVKIIHPDCPKNVIQKNILNLYFFISMIWQVLFIKQLPDLLQICVLYNSTKIFFVC